MPAPGHEKIDRGHHDLAAADFDLSADREVVLSGLMTDLGRKSAIDVVLLIHETVSVGGVKPPSSYDISTDRSQPSHCCKPPQVQGRCGRLQRNRMSSLRCPTAPRG